MPTSPPATIFEINSVSRRDKYNNATIATMDKSDLMRLKFSLNTKYAGTYDLMFSETDAEGSFRVIAQRWFPVGDAIDAVFLLTDIPQPKVGYWKFRFGLVETESASA